jgi:O-succinylbenzoic acid--CoA ligase
VGGESLSPSLYKAARDLNWPLLPSYGLTECGSQVATAELDSLGGKKYPPIRVLSHVQVKIVQEEIALRSESLMSGFVPLLDLKDLSLGEGQVFWVPASVGRAEEAGVKGGPGFRIKSGMREGWYFTGDKGELQEDFLQVKRASQIKIRGEKVNFKNMEETLMSVLLKKTAVSGRYFLLPVPSEREGFQLSLVSDVFDPKTLSEIIKEFNTQVSPFEKIQQFYFVPELPLVGISKVSKQALLEILGFSPRNPT